MRRKEAPHPADRRSLEEEGEFLRDGDADDVDVQQQAGRLGTQTSVDMAASVTETRPQTAFYFPLFRILRGKVSPWSAAQLAGRSFGTLRRSASGKGGLR